jgi:hypothetical protein
MIRAVTRPKRTVVARKHHTLEQVGRAQPHAFFVQHENKLKKNPHYIPVKKR